MQRVDVVLVGGGVMSATLGTLIKKLEPGWDIVVVEKLSDVGLESSSPWNNAGTGHSALCELNYTPENANGDIVVDNAIKVNHQFQISRQLWSWLVESGDIPDPSSFLTSVPHMSLVTGQDNVRYLRKRYEALAENPLFSGLQYSEDPLEIARWAPLTIDGRLKSEPIAATRVVQGTDIDFGALTTQLMVNLKNEGVRFITENRVTNLTKTPEGTWQVRLRHELGQTPQELEASFVFVGAGGAALPLLQKSGIKEIRGYGGFPVSGEWLRCDNPDVVRRHNAKVYGRAAVGAPPMSVPHLDTRVVDGQSSLLFGPYAGFTPKFLKKGSVTDLFSSLRWHNILPMLAVAAQNLSLVVYLAKEVFASRSKKLEALYEFYPDADPADWYKMVAGQRVQVIKPDPKKIGVLQFGTEVIASEDGTIAGLLGASPGASTAAPIMVNVLEKCFPNKIATWTPKLKQMVPAYGLEGRERTEVMVDQMFRTAQVLNI
jgi:malate dehydrogenase (quinone)